MSAKLSAKPYVLHFCKDRQCNNGWLAPDEYGVKSLPPRHLYCFDCEVYEGKSNRKDPSKVQSGKRLAILNKRKRQRDALLEGII